eukprot:GHUV01001905.1.p1 GENE.GHUV01001905.1~~GHUV01001905.1.p1  ORF type:complete len:466 (+),score=104.33 GHUV01001905.1:323-1720(+)
MLTSGVQQRAYSCSNRQAHLRPSASRAVTPASIKHRRSLPIMHFKQNEAQWALQQATGSETVNPSATEVFDAMTTMLGGLEETNHVGYAGQWRTWDVSAATAADSSSSSSNSGPGSSVPTQISSAGVLIDDGINIRLWRITDKESYTVQQSNLYQTPAMMAGPSTRFLPYLSGNTMSGRPDGYGLRVWNFKPDSALTSPDARAWRGNPSAAESSMCVLTVPHTATTIINGALPSGFEESHQPRFWVLEFIIKEANKSDRRWASMNWYELGQLVVNRSINEDHTTLPDDLDARFIDPKHYQERWQPRRTELIGDIEDYASKHIDREGTATTFSYDADLQLTSCTHPCSWTKGAALQFEAPGMQLEDAQYAAQHQEHAAPGASGKSSSLVNGSDLSSVLMQQSYPDMSYCRVPRNIESMVDSGRPTIVFEAGSVLRDGSLGRWVLEYFTTGDRLLKTATYEQYPAKA